MRLRLLLSALVTLASSARGQAGTEEIIGPPLLSANRLAALPAAERAQWMTYITRSKKLHAQDSIAMKAELASVHQAGMTKAPYEAPDFRFGERSVAWFASDSAQMLARSVLSWQTNSGGWSKRTSMWQPREPGTNFFSETESWHYTPTFDNGATTGQLRFLAEMMNASSVPAYAKAFGRGLTLALQAQQPNGCWPQTYPLEGGYHDAATFNDDVTVLVLRLLDDVANRKWAFVSSAQQRVARASAVRGVSCLLEAQVKVKGVATVWGQQHDPLTLELVPARRYELAGLAGRESAAIMQYLMSLATPESDVVRAVNAAAIWFESHAVHGYRYAGYNLTRDSTAPPLWARLTEVATERPIFANRDAVKLYDWDQLTDRRSGYGWFGTEPAMALAQYKVWSPTHGQKQ